ncbi:hypothetical protein [Pseudomonas aeruginosa]|uniref:hypothetical protein n=1 Tax=Pseudomonas aeruginosa TaxID=287 RepID=UPI00070A7BEF|nr:hypothetical protein [Pseudomonas aeruginosa]
MDEPLFNELMESVKQADQIMSDHAELRRLAKACDVSRCADEGEERRRLHDFYDCVEPELILELLDEIDGLRSRLEIDERTPHDGIACRDETIKVLDEKCDRLKAESDRLRQGMKGDYDIDAWLDWSKEKERLKAENEVLRGALQAVVDDPTWRSNDNTLWPKIIKALDKGTTK